MSVAALDEDHHGADHLGMGVLAVVLDGTVAIATYSLNYCTRDDRLWIEFYALETGR